MGGIVLATGVLAGLSSSYAVYAIFGPKVQPAGFVEEAMARFLSAVIGLLWGAIIFNLDRYIVSSTGKGDGTDRITWNEFTNALPRLVMGAILGISIAVPLETRILKPEIDARIGQLKTQQLLVADSATTLRFAADTAQVHQQLGLQQRRTDAAQQRVELLRAEATRELDGTGGSGRASNGPIYRRKIEEAEEASAQLAELKRQLAPEQDALREQLATTLADLKAAKAANQQSANAMDGLLLRVKAAHELSPAFTWMIRLIFLCIEITPILFKLMAVKGTYDYLEENYKEIIKAQHGIASGVKLHGIDGNIKLVEQTVFHEAKRLLAAFLTRMLPDATAPAPEGRVAVSLEGTSPEPHTAAQ